MLYFIRFVIRQEIQSTKNKVDLNNKKIIIPPPQSHLRTEEARMNGVNTQKIMEEEIWHVERSIASRKKSHDQLIVPALIATYRVAIPCNSG